MTRGSRSTLVMFLVVSLLANAFCVPAGQRPKNNQRQSDESNSLSSTTTKDPFSDDDDDDFDTADSMQPSSSGSGSNIGSLLNVVGALFPGSSSSSTNKAIMNMMKQYLRQHQTNVINRRQDIADNVIDVDYITALTPPFLRQEEDYDSGHNDSNGDHVSESHSESEEDKSSDDDDTGAESEEANNAAEESVENDKDDENDKASKQDSNGDDNDDDDSDYSDEPEGDGQGGGILGLLAGLSGGEDGSDLGTLLATVSQIVGNLSGDGFDLNSLIATAFGLFVGILSEGKENPGEVIASYILTSLDTITGGGANNNGVFFGKFLSKLVKGISEGNSASGGQSSPLWTLKMDILRAILQFGTSILGLASTSFSSASTL